MVLQSLSTALFPLVLLSGVSLGLAGPPRHKHEIRDVPSALTSTQTEDETTQYYYFTESYTSLPPFWPPRPTPHSSDSTTSTTTTSSPEYPYYSDSDTTTSSSNFTTPTTTWNFTTPYTTTWTSYSDTWGDHNTYPTPSSAATDDETTTISVIKTLTSFTTTVVSKTVNKPSSTKPSRTSSSKSFTFKTTPFANLTTFTSPKWTTVPVASLTGTPFCSNAADPDSGVGNHCVCGNGETVGVIPFSRGGNASDYQPCAYTTVG
ncbi:hypothetical protein B0H65DRAFT_570867 [Neurospora tetraspora]|uniref:Uncharacterized protein n=1 Tax=Neurospora tetraspora TaxID=94610 RepID=A0AAE0JH16_9PEZI|nr:hypothetical protein B0H65DRAFT_570867 [Neurospora tetraspora]